MEQVNKVIKGALLVRYGGFVPAGGLAAIVSIASLGELMGNVNLAIYGQQVEGIVIDADRTKIEFTTADDRIWTFSPNINFGLAKYELGQKVEVVYIRKPPNMEINNAYYMWIFPIASALFCALLATFFLGTYYRLIKAKTN